MAMPEQSDDRTAVATSRLADVKIYVLLTESLCRCFWLDTAEAFLRGGVDCLQLREKSLPDRQLLDRAKRLAAMCTEHGALFIVNDRPDIARLSGACGVHLGQGDMSVADARRILGPCAVVGVSTHTRDQVRDAIAAGPDYVAVGPMFASSTKPQQHIAGPLTLTAARALMPLPLVAIGGITEFNAPEVLAAAAGVCLCVCSAVLGDGDPQSAVQRLRAVVAASQTGGRGRTSLGG